MSNKGLLIQENPARNAALLAALLPITFLSDFKLDKDGLHCFFKLKIPQLQCEIETFLTAMNEISDDQFYFEQVSEYEAILKVFSSEKLQFHSQLLFDSPKPIIQRE